MGRLGNWRATYTPGRWVVLAGPSALVIMPPAPASASTLLNDLWDDLLGAGSMPELAERLAGFRIDQLPSFAAFFWHGDHLRSLMRGAVSAIDIATGARVAEGADVVTWVEAGLGDVTRVRIDLEPVDQDNILQLPLVTGVVTASALVLDATAAPSSVQIAGAEAAVVPATEPEPESEAKEPEAPVAQEAAAETVPETDDELAPAPTGGRLIVGDMDPAAEMWGTPAPPAAEPDQPAWAEPEPAWAESSQPEWARETFREGDPVAQPVPGAPVAASAAEPPAPHEDAPTQQFPALSAASAPSDDTQLMASVDRPGGTEPEPPPSPWGTPAPGFAVGLPPVPGGGPGAPGGFATPPPYGQPSHPGQISQPGQPGHPGPRQPGQQPNPFAQPAAPGSYGNPNQPLARGWQPQHSATPDPAHSSYAQPPEPPAPAMPTGGGVISAVPDFSGHSAPPPTPAPGAGDQADHDGATIFQTGLARALKSAPTGGGRDESFVLASVCVQQHPNPPGVTQCRLCSSPVPPQNPRLVARPVLATLRPSSGSAVEVDRNVLIGRAPSASRVARDQLPRLLTVPSPSHDISRTHVQVHPEEWNIVVTDLHSTNGTTLVHPGGDERERLVPGEPVIVAIGSVLDLGDGITVLVDAP